MIVVVVVEYNYDFSGSLGNILTIVVIGRTRRLYNHCTPFLLSLAIGEFSLQPLSDIEIWKVSA